MPHGLKKSNDFFSIRVIIMGGVGRSPAANLPSFVRYTSKTRGNESGILRGGSPLGEGVA